MKSTVKAAAVMLAVVLALSLTGCLPGREYRTVIEIPLSDGYGKLVIREWQFLVGSGAEASQVVNGEKILLGECGGGDDGYCPFEGGQYTVEQDGGSVTIRWLFNTTIAEGEIWREKTFTLTREG